MNKKEAKAQGLKRYRGKDCDKHGAVERTVSNSTCVECNKERKRNSRDIPSDNAKRRIRYHRVNTVEEWISRPVTYAKSRAKLHNLPFDLDRDYLLSIWTGVCPVFGLELSFNNPGRTNPDNQASLDRVIPSLGYVKGNVEFISYRANMIKSNATSAELFKVAEWLAGIEPSR